MYPLPGPRRIPGAPVLAAALAALALGPARAVVVADAAPGGGAVAVRGAAAGGTAPAPRNVILFVADGLRAGSVTPAQAPTLHALATRGVAFPNSHSVVPTLTMVNAAAIATGHQPGDTGLYANTLYAGFEAFDRGTLGRPPGSPLPFIESDIALADLDAHQDGSFLGEETLLSLARAHGYATASIGKLGPTALQDVRELAPVGDRLPVPATILMDDRSGSADGVPLDPQVLAALGAAGLPGAAPPHGAPPADAGRPEAVHAGTPQQAWLLSAATRAVLPLLRQSGRPFLVVFWSRDPDGTQHGQHDSAGALVPGINGPSSLAAVRNADDNLAQLLAALQADAGLAATTDVFVTSDHGFATISRHDIDAQGHATRSGAAALHYDDVPAGHLPPGFLALDLAAHLGLPLFDPDAQVGEGRYRAYRRLGAGEHPAGGDGLIGGTGAIGAGGTDARVLVAANGGVDLVYLPQRDAPLLADIVAFLGRQDYVGGLFTDDAYGPLPGTLPVSSIGLQGAGKLPAPALLVSFRGFEVQGGVARGRLAGLLNTAQVSDTGLQQGQGMHGALLRADTLNFMAAAGPGLRTGWRDPLPVGNADLAPTIAALLGWEWPGHGALGGRVLSEALADRAGARAGGAAPRAGHERCERTSLPGTDRRTTVLEYQRYDGRTYVDAAHLGPQRRPPGEYCHRARGPGGD